MSEPFWKRKSLAEMSRAEWESLCDGCALCCLHKVQDEDTDDIYYTDIACRLLDMGTCRCTNYANRKQDIPACLVLDAGASDAFRWLPASCAYRRLARGQDLPDWHPLVTGDPDSVHAAGISVKAFAVSENEMTEWSIMADLGANEE